MNFFTKDTKTAFEAITAAQFIAFAPIVHISEQCNCKTRAYQVQGASLDLEEANQYGNRICCFSHSTRNPMSSAPVAIGHFIGGKAHTGSASRSQPVTNPATGVVTGHVALANSADVDAAVAAAQAAFRQLTVDS